MDTYFQTSSFACNHHKCKKSKLRIYNTVEGLNEHLRKSHLLTNCNQCGKFFNRKNLKKHTEKHHGGSVVCQFCLRPFGKQRRLLRRHYKYCNKAQIKELYNNQKARLDLNTCFAEFYKKKELQHFSKVKKEKKVKQGTIPKRHIQVPVPIKYRHRSISARPNIIGFFE